MSSITIRTITPLFARAAAGSLIGIEAGNRIRAFAQTHFARNQTIRNLPFFELGVTACVGLATMLSTEALVSMMVVNLVIRVAKLIFSAIHRPQPNQIPSFLSAINASPLAMPEPTKRAIASITLYQATEHAIPVVIGPSESFARMLGRWQQTRTDKFYLLAPTVTGWLPELIQFLNDNPTATVAIHISDASMAGVVMSLLPQYKKQIIINVSDKNVIPTGQNYKSVLLPPFTFEEASPDLTLAIDAVCAQHSTGGNTVTVARDVQKLAYSIAERASPAADTILETSQFIGFVIRGVLQQPDRAGDLPITAAHVVQYFNNYYTSPFPQDLPDFRYETPPFLSPFEPSGFPLSVPVLKTYGQLKVLTGERRDFPIVVCPRESLTRMLRGLTIPAGSGVQLYALDLSQFLATPNSLFLLKRFLDRNSNVILSLEVTEYLPHQDLMTALVSTYRSRVYISVKNKATLERLPPCDGITYKSVPFPSPKFEEVASELSSYVMHELRQTATVAAEAQELAYHLVERVEKVADPVVAASRLIAFVAKRVLQPLRLVGAAADPNPPPTAITKDHVVQYFKDYYPDTDFPEDLPKFQYGVPSFLSSFQTPTAAPATLSEKTNETLRIIYALRRIPNRIPALVGPKEAANRVWRDYSKTYGSGSNRPIYVLDLSKVEGTAKVVFELERLLKQDPNIRIVVHIASEEECGHKLARLLIESYSGQLLLSVKNGNILPRLLQTSDKPYHLFDLPSLPFDEARLDLQTLIRPDMEPNLLKLVYSVVQKALPDVDLIQGTADFIAFAKKRQELQGRASVTDARSLTDSLKVYFPGADVDAIVKSLDPPPPPPPPQPPTFLIPLTARPLPQDYLNNCHRPLKDALGIGGAPILIGDPQLTPQVLSGLGKPVFKLDPTLSIETYKGAVQFVKTTKPIIYIDHNDIVVRGRDRHIPSNWQTYVGEACKLYIENGAEIVYLSTGESFSTDAGLISSVSGDKTLFPIYVHPLNDAQLIKAVQDRLPESAARPTEDVVRAALFFAKEFCSKPNDPVAMATSLIQLTAIRVKEIALSDVVQTVFNHRAHSNLRELPTETLRTRFETTGRTPSLQATSDVKHVPDFLTNMNHESRRREQGVHGIDETIQWIEIILRKSDTANPVLVGQSGAGKTTIVEEFARRLDKGAITHFKGYTIYRLNMSSFLATDGYMGQLDKKIKMLIQFFTENSNSILFIDEIHGLAGTGTHTSRPASPVINALKQHLTQTSSPRILMIGATTPSELLLLRDDALLRRLTEVPISTPDQTQLANTMKQELDSGTYSKNYGREISFVSGAGEFAVRLIESLPPDPSKDVSAMSRTSDLIDTACSLATHSSEGSVTINCEQIAKAFVRLYPKAEETSESLMSKFLPSAQPAL